MHQVTSSFDADHSSEDGFGLVSGGPEKSGACRGCRGIASSVTSVAHPRTFTGPTRTPRCQEQGAENLLLVTLDARDVERSLSQLAIWHQQNAIPLQSKPAKGAMSFIFQRWLWWRRLDPVVLSQRRIRSGAKRSPSRIHKARPAAQPCCMLPTSEQSRRSKDAITGSAPSEPLGCLRTGACRTSMQRDDLTCPTIPTPSSGVSMRRR